MIDILHEIYLDSAFFNRLDQNETSLTKDKDKTTWNLKWRVIFRDNSKACFTCYICPMHQAGSTASHVP